MEVEMVEPMEVDEFVDFFCKPDLDFESKIEDFEAQLSKHPKVRDVNNTKNAIENNDIDVKRNLKEEKLTLRAKRFNMSVDTMNNNRLSALKSEDLYFRFQQLANKHGNKREAFLTGIDIFSEEEKRKKEERAKRFGLDNKVNDASQKKEDLYSSLGIDESSESFKNLRLNAVHMRGTNDMTTDDVFKYFKYYTPSAIEWINDESCNVVWLDAITAARALKGLSKRILGLDAHKTLQTDVFDHVSDDIRLNEEFEDENSIHVKDINHQIPPGYWRKGVDYGVYSRSILLRFATNSDKKTSYLDRVSKNKTLPAAKYQQRGNNNRLYHNNGNSSVKRPWTDLDDVDQDYASYKRIAQKKVVYTNFDDDDEDDNDNVEEEEETENYVLYKRKPNPKRCLNMKDRLGYKTATHENWSNLKDEYQSFGMLQKNSRFLSKDDLRHKISSQSKSQLNYYD